MSLKLYFCSLRGENRYFIGRAHLKGKSKSCKCYCNYLLESQSLLNPYFYYYSRLLGTLLWGKTASFKNKVNHDEMWRIWIKNYPDIFGSIFVSRNVNQLVLFAVQQKFHIHCFFFNEKSAIFFGSCPKANSHVKVFYHL